MFLALHKDQREVVKQIKHKQEMMSQALTSHYSLIPKSFLSILTNGKLPYVPTRI